MFSTLWIVVVIPVIDPREYVLAEVLSMKMESGFADTPRRGKLIASAVVELTAVMVPNESSKKYPSLWSAWPL